MNHGPIDLQSIALPLSYTPSDIIALLGYLLFNLLTLGNVLMNRWFLVSNITKPPLRHQNGNTTVTERGGESPRVTFDVSNSMSASSTHSLNTTESSRVLVSDRPLLSLVHGTTIQTET